jgi:hypothetical protein
MKVWVYREAKDGIWCGECVREVPGPDDPPALAELRAIELPLRPRNRVLDIALGRLACDACGGNLEDLEAEFAAHPKLATVNPYL